ncbi:hypothetical protein NEFER01_1770 [Nematocida sp. LUAm1]|nr:hypothetical protein NEFER02_1615 [Nematocida sp. LUAm2]KAI5178634.1 hypothetical protein NEFER01_1770 [Nematocida sp. LUAm1]
MKRQNSSKKEKTNPDGLRMSIPKGAKIEEKEEYICIEVTHPIVEKRGVLISEVDNWLVEYFPFKNFNQMQAEVACALLYTDGNIMVSSPVGTGKGEVALLGALREYKRAEKEMKVVYIAPTRALLNETMKRFKERFKEKINCLLDTSENRASTYDGFNILFTTPEKFDLISRKKIIDIHLMVIDEIHILGEPRGDCLETIIIREIERKTRIVGLSASIPNYLTVGKFIQAEEKNSFYFGSEYKEVPVTHKIFGVKKEYLEDKKIEEKVLFPLIQGRTIIFLSSREACFNLANTIFTHPKREENLTSILEAIFYEITTSNIFEKKEKDELVHLLSLPEYFSFSKGVGIHHSGVPRVLRDLCELLFSRGILSVICATATLSVGVNLPAETVIVYGTKIFKRDSGYTEYSFGEISQMSGRAGRKGLCGKGTAAIITEQENLLFYTRISSFLLPIKSALLPSLPKRILYEICMKKETIYSLTNWITKTFFFLETSQNKNKNKTENNKEKENVINQNEHEKHKETCPHRLISACIEELLDLQMIEKKEQKYSSTFLGNISFALCAHPKDIYLFNEMLKFIRKEQMFLDGGDILLIISTSSDFNLFSLSNKERDVFLSEPLPYPIKNPQAPLCLAIENTCLDRSASINPSISLLVQLYISNRKLFTSSFYKYISLVETSFPRLLLAFEAISIYLCDPCILSVLRVQKALSHGRWMHIGEEELLNVSAQFEETSQSNINLHISNPELLPLVICISCSRNPQQLVTLCKRSSKTFSFTLPSLVPRETYKVHIEHQSAFKNPFILFFSKK